MRSWFEDHRDVLGPLGGSQQLTNNFLLFEGNAQSLRLVATLHVLADYTGLNLTYGTLSASMKYVASSEQANRRANNKSLRKPGYFASEQDVVSDVRDKTGTGGARNPICYLVEAADDIVYLAADVEDGVKKGVLRWSWLERTLKERGGPSIASSLAGMERILGGRPLQHPTRP